MKFKAIEIKISQNMIKSRLYISKQLSELGSRLETGIGNKSHRIYTEIQRHKEITPFKRRQKRQKME